MFTQRLLAALGLSALLAVPPLHAQTQERLSWLDLISPDAVMQLLLTQALAISRRFGDMTYQSLDVNVLAGRLSLHEI